MDAHTHPLKKVFELQCRYLVPLFQRRYVWERDKQWEPLWEDISTVAERFVRKEPMQPHFMGAVVFEQLPTETGTLDSRQIIDGQQRLTTLQLLIGAARDFCGGLGDVANKYFRSLSLLTVNGLVQDEPDLVFKVWPTNSDRLHFSRAMSAGSAEALRAEYGAKTDSMDLGHPIANAYLFFYQKILDWVNPAQIEALVPRLEAIQNTFYQALLLVVIDLDEKDNAQVIFETLNARGTPLLAADLVKNYLLYMADRQGASLEKLYEKYWEPFDREMFWQEEIQQGRFFRPRMDIFLQHYLTLIVADEVSPGNLFVTYRDYIKSDDGQGPEPHLASLRKFGDIFRSFYAQTPRHSRRDVLSASCGHGDDHDLSSAVAHLRKAIWSSVGTFEKNHAGRHRVVSGATHDLWIANPRI